MEGDSWPAGYGRVVLDSVASTNAEALLRAGVAPTWVAARRQTAGRGRLGRAWSTEPGNLAASLLLPETPARPATLGFVAGLALSSMLEETAGLETRLKWPNDVLAEGRKIAGILLESGMEGDAMVVGIGVNLEHAPGDAAWKAVSVRELRGSSPSFEEALASLARQWHAWHERWRRGFGEVRRAWLAKAEFLGERIRVRLPREELHGVFRGLDEDGVLILATEGGLRRIGAGEVYGA